MLKRTRPWAALIFVVVLACFGLPAQLQGQGGPRNWKKGMLRDVESFAKDLARHYFDSTYNGLNLDTLQNKARTELINATNYREGNRALERMAAAFNDSHTFFVKPWRIGLDDFHFGIRFIGEVPFVVHVDSLSQADSAGLRRGDEIVEFDGKPITRANYVDVVHDFFTSSPVRSLNLKVRAPDRSFSHIALNADTTAIDRLRGKQFRQFLSNYRDSTRIANAHVQASIGQDIFVWRLPEFVHDDAGISKVMKRVREHSTLILDLRGNEGGSIETLNKLLEHFVMEELLTGELELRRTRERFVAKPRKEIFEGRLFVLVDSETGSAAEIFTRLMQLKRNAIAIGDQTAGAVRASRWFNYGEGTWASISVSDFVLYNGERLEKIGVRPDIIAVPTAAHIAGRTDPVLSLALLRAGFRLSPEAAARLLPVR